MRGSAAAGRVSGQMPEADAVVPAVPGHAAAAAAGDGGSGCSPRLGCYGFMALNILMGLYCSVAYAVSTAVAGAVTIAVALLLLALAGRIAHEGGSAAASSGRLLLSRCACGLAGTAGIGVQPAFAYDGEARGSAVLCAVCLEDVRGGEMVRLLPACGHLFHEDCVDVWLRVRRTCPLCRCVLPSRKSTATAAAATASSAAVLLPV